MIKAQARQKAKELVAKMTVEERLSQLVYNSPAIERLGIDEYNWWNEGSLGGHQPDSVSDKLLGYPCLKIEV